MNASIVRSASARSRLLGVLALLAVLLTGGPGHAHPRPVQVSVAVDFGPAGRPPLEKSVQLAARSTVFEALRAAYRVTTSGR